MGDRAEYYQRDLHGYGRMPPLSTWPNGARVAVQVVVNYEEGGENCLLHGDSGSEAFLSEIVGAESWPDARHWNMESIYEYGARAGFWRLWRILNDAGVKPTVFGVATALARSPSQTAAMLESDWEIASHGLKWIEYRGFSRDEERRHMEAAIRLHTAVTGQEPRGWYTGRCSMNTMSLAAETGLFEYLSDSYADDLPYWLKFKDRNQLVVPYTLDANDMRFATAQGFNSGTQFFEYLRDSLDQLLEECAHGSAKMMSVGLHCRLAGRPGRARALKRFLDYANKQTGVWFARRIDIARYWAKNCPPSGESMPRLMTMDRRSFVSCYGAVFEHSPWIAERAFDLECGPGHENCDGLHHLLCRAFRAASRDEKMQVIKAHPDLAGKLAQARRLTAESTNEQASAGLDALTDEERSRFTSLNVEYLNRFGFPFIIAVRDHTRASILDAFARRVAGNEDDEFNEACTQIERIAWHRLNSIFNGHKE